MSRRWSPSAFRPVGRTVHPPQPSPNHARRYTERLRRLELQESEAQEVLLQTIHGHLARLISVFVLPMRLPRRTVAVQGDDFVRMGVTAAIRRSRRQLWTGRHPRNAAPHFAARASASTSAKAETGANVSFQANGLQASMIIFECAVCGVDARVERRAPGVADDIDGFGRFAAGRDRPRDVGQVRRVDVFVDYDDEPRHVALRRRDQPRTLAGPP